MREDFYIVEVITFSYLAVILYLWGNYLKCDLDHMLVLVIASFSVEGVPAVCFYWRLCLGF